MQVISVLHVCARCCLALNTPCERVEITVVSRHSRGWQGQTLVQVVMVKTQSGREVMLISEVSLKDQRCVSSLFIDVIVLDTIRSVLLVHRNIAH